MTPRIFVSSTYYDLRHVRERLERFIKNYGFEPVLFESDKVTYEHGKPVDQSAYAEVELCHIMVLIIGGRYGSPASNSNVEIYQNKYDEEYISITRKELEKALESRLPLFIFIDKKVHAEYETYKENEQFFDELNQLDKVGKQLETRFSFAHVDSPSVFRFIDIVRNQPIKTFDKVEEIENYLQSQFAGYFYLYLDSLKKASEERKILKSVQELNSVIVKMNEMVNSVGKKIFEPAEYENVISNQYDALIAIYCRGFSKYLSFNKHIEIQEQDGQEAARVIFQIGVWPKIVEWGSQKSLDAFLDELTKERIHRIEAVNSKLLAINPDLSLKAFDYREMQKDFFIAFPKGLGEHEMKFIVKAGTEITELSNPLPF